MAAMRQRLLLAAGWIIAAVGSGVVASGAVAVAGGQVLDRPLRPLTAAEVAALPVVRTMDARPIEPLASGGSGSTSGDSTGERSDDDGAATPADAASAGPGGAPPVSPVGEVLIITRSPEPTDAIDAEITQTGIVYLRGGAASILASSEGLDVLWARPNPGYVMGLFFEDEERLILSFTSPATRYSLTAEIVEGELLVATAEEPIL